MGSNPTTATTILPCYKAFYILFDVLFRFPYSMTCKFFCQWIFTNRSYAEAVSGRSFKEIDIPPKRV